MAIAYLVTSGSYSEYTVHRVFLDREKAEKFCDIGNRDRHHDYDIDEFEITDKVPGRSTLWTAQYDRRLDEISEPYPLEFWDDETLPPYYPSGDEPKIEYNKAFSTLTVLCTDRERALKIVSDKAAEIRAVLADIT